MVAYHTSSYLKYKIMTKFNSDNPREKILMEYSNITKNIIKKYQE